MADNTVFDSRNNQISKDVHGSDNPIPLSPQWLFPKPGDNKPGNVAGENHFTPSPGYASPSDVVKKKDVFRPAVLDMDSGRRDRWRDEERDTNSSVRKDRWRETNHDQRRESKWNTETNHDQRRESKWNPETNHDQRRESKWNTRWGPDDKESESLREKWVDPSRDVDTPLDKVLPQLTNHAKDGREGDHYRPWRSNAQNQGRVDPPPHHQTPLPNKQGPMFAYGRGRGENAVAPSLHDRGRFGPSGSSMNRTQIHSQPFGTALEKGEVGQGESSPFRYSRTKLLDLYRMTDINSFLKPLDGVVPVPSLTQEETSDPLAFCAPTPDELVTLEGIEKGDIVSSGAPQISKEGSIGRSSNDYARRPKLGSREDLPLSIDDYKGENVGNSKGSQSSHTEGLSYEEQMHSYGLDAKVEMKQDQQTYSDNKLYPGDLRKDGGRYRMDEAAMNRDTSLLGNSSVHGTAWQSPSFGEQPNVKLRDWREMPADVMSRSSDMSWQQSRKDLNTESGFGLADLSYPKDESKWQAGGDPTIRRNPSAVMDKEQETLKLSQTSPEDLLLYYRDPRGAVQGPFPGIDIIGWFEAGYFGIDLQVRLANAPPDSPFFQLGDVMPHLRAKARPPPGFTAPKDNDLVPGSLTSNSGTFGKIHASLSDIDIMKAEERYRQGSTTEAENKFLESLMSGNTSNLSASPLEKFAFSQGLQGYGGNNSSGVPPSGLGSEDNLYLLAKRMALERQKSLPGTYPFWPGRDAAPMVPNVGIAQDSLTPHPTLLSGIGDSHQSQNLTPILQGLPPASGFNTGISGRPTFPVQGGLDPLQEKLELHQRQNFPPQASFGLQQQRIQPQSQPSLTDLIAQTIDNSSGILRPEKLLQASGLAQDPQLLSLLQQQYLLQLHSQAPVHPSQQISVLDKLLLLKQQQQQEEQQQLLRQQQQQQQLLSQVLSDYTSHQQRLGEQSYGQFQAPAVPSQEFFQMGLQIPVTKVQEHVHDSANLDPSVSRGSSHNFGSVTTSTHLPHQFFENTTTQQNLGAVLRERIDDMQQIDSSQSATVVNSLPQSEVANRSTHEQMSQNNLRTNEAFAVTMSEASVQYAPLEHQANSVAEESAAKLENESSVPEQENDLIVPPIGALEEAPVEIDQQNEEISEMKEVKNVEVREVKKAADKKSKKQRASKAQSSDQAKGVSKATSLEQSKPSGTEVSNLADTKNEVNIDLGEILHRTSLTESAESKSGVGKVDKVDYQQVKDSFPVSSFNDGTESMDVKVDSTSTGPRAWKHAPGFKPKSLLEIQEEEQRKAQTEMENSEISMSVNPVSFSTPWAGVLAGSDHKTDSSSAKINLPKPDSYTNQKSKKSQLHDILAEEVPAKSQERDVEVSDSISFPLMNSQFNLADDDDFIDAKDTKKNRKKSAKAKGVGAKVMVPISSPEVSVGSIANEKRKGSRQVLKQEKEVLPAVPYSPSLGDFVVWKGETANAPPAPAWSSDSGKLPKAASMRDILREQGKKVSSIPHQTSILPQKPQPTEPSRGSASGSLSASTPTKAASPIQIVSNASAQSKHKGDDDLFWGPLDQRKQEAKQLDFPHLAGQGSWGTKSSPGKGTLGGSASRQKSTGGRHAEHSLSSSPASAQSSMKGKKNAMSKHSEAMGFRDWCESESVRLLGTKDTSFLEFCVKQSRSEAEVLLIENLGIFDPDHKFIDKFLNYKDMLPEDVLEIAFQSRNDRGAPGFGARDVSSDNGGAGESEQGDNDPVGADDSKRGGGKKKGKKGKKVSPAVLGFNVVSNRIMMGEIQSIDE